MGFTIPLLSLDGINLIVNLLSSVVPYHFMIADREADVILAIGTELGETDYDVVFDNGFAVTGQLIRIDIQSRLVKATRM